MRKHLKEKKGKIERRRNLTLVTDENVPFSYREAYKSLRTNVKFVAAIEHANSFVITSALQMESKSNVASNLAVTLAEEGSSVVLLDGDFRKPTIHRFFNIKMQGKGITSVLTGKCSLDKVLYHDKTTKVDLLPVGIIPPNPTELLATAQMQEILKELKERYDYVIVDTPPVSVVTDAAILGGIVDGAFLVIRSDFAPLEMVQLAKKKLEDVHVRIYGVILSRYNARKTGRQSGYYYSYNDYSYSYDKENSTSGKN